PPPGHNSARGPRLRKGAPGLHKGALGLRRGAPGLQTWIAEGNKKPLRWGSAGARPALAKETRNRRLLSAAPIQVCKPGPPQIKPGPPDGWGSPLRHLSFRPFHKLAAEHVHLVLPHPPLEVGAVVQVVL